MQTSKSGNENNSGAASLGSPSLEPPTSSFYGRRLTPSEIEELRQDLKAANERYKELARMDRLQKKE